MGAANLVLHHRRDPHEINSHLAFHQATSSSQEANGESTDSQSPVPPLVDVSSSSSTDMGENCNSTTPNDSGSSLPSADSSTGRSSTRLNARSGNDSSSSATS